MFTHECHGVVVSSEGCPLKTFESTVNACSAARSDSVSHHVSSNMFFFPFPQVNELDLINMLSQKKIHLH